MARIFELGDFRLDPEVGVLLRDGRPTGLGTHAVAVLATLVERATEYVSKRALLDAGWPQSVVEEGNVAMQIVAIRRVLAAGGGGAWIETLPRRGYRFVGPVKRLTGEPAPVSPAQRSNLPATLPSFIGRERELADIKRLLARNRLVTVGGAGGIGKTRLALQVASEVLDAYRDGVWLVELGSIREPALVLTTIAQSLGLEERARTPPTEALGAYLKTRQFLLVLDNCEHLLDACALAVDSVLRNAKEATIIATSREPLRISGEQSYVLTPLSLPDACSPETTRSSEAVQLFVERVRQQLPGFEFTRERETAVAGICTHLDGIPLALELAAARTRSLALEQIHARLSDRFRLLTDGSRTALPRQQTLRATLDWSYDLLGEAERTVLRRLSVFPGSFGIEAASAVAADPRIDNYAVIDVVAQLVSRSLVVADVDGGAMRYRMLETTRAYALEKLVEGGERERCRRLHAEYVRDLFEPAEMDRFRMRDADWVAMYAPELPSVREALDWALDEMGDGAVAVALAGASGPLWVALGLFTEGERRLEAAGGIAERGSDAQQARLWAWLGKILDEAPHRASATLQRAVDLYRQLDEPVSLGLALVRSAKVFALMGKFEASEAALTEARPLLEAGAMPALLGYCLFNFGFLKSLSGDPVAARGYYEQSLAIDRQTGFEFGVLATLGNLANVTWALGDLTATEASLREQIALVRASPLRTNRLLGWTLTSLACVLTEQGRIEHAVEAAREGLPLVAESGSAWMFIDGLALCAALAGRYHAAARLAGFIDRTFVAKEATRHPIDVRHRTRLDAALRDNLGAAELARLLAEGAALSEEQAHRLALDE